MIVTGKRIGKIGDQVHRAVMRALERHAPGEYTTWAIVMEYYEEYLGKEFKDQMSSECGVEYPLNIIFHDQKPQKRSKYE